MYIVKIPPGCVLARCGCTWWIVNRKGEIGIKRCNHCGFVFHEPSPMDLEHLEIRIEFVTYEEYAKKNEQEKTVRYPSGKKQYRTKARRAVSDGLVSDNRGESPESEEDHDNSLWEI